MSSEEAEALSESLANKWNSKRQRTFVSRMERKLSHKEHSGRF